MTHSTAIIAVLSSFLILSSPSLAQSVPDSVIECTMGNNTTLEKLAYAQVAQPFKNKFALVAPDLKMQANKNLSALNNAMSSMPYFSALKFQGAKLGEKIEEQMVLIHGTRYEYASSILRSGYLLSKDELIRRKILDINAKKSMTNAMYDGAIGEQDVIYLAYQNESKEAGYGFGDVFFEFDKTPVLNQGYLTLNSFTVGSPQELNFSQCDQKVFKNLTDGYRNIIFSGADQVRTLLTLSAIQYLHYKDTFNTSPYDSAESLLAQLQKQYDDASNKAIETANKTQKPYKQPFFPNTDAWDFCKVLAGIGQRIENCKNELLKPEEKKNILRAIYSLQDISDTARWLIHGFATFPLYGEPANPMILRPLHWFWEVKVPTQLSLENLKAVIVPLETQDTSRPWHGMGPMPTMSTKPLVDEIERFALNHHLKIERENLPKNKVRFKLIKN